ncbi:hypothetical protein SLA2020_284880 [Shorea laevis]
MASPPSSSFNQIIDRFEAMLDSEMREVRKLFAAMNSRMDQLMQPPVPSPQLSQPNTPSHSTPSHHNNIAAPPPQKLNFPYQSQPETPTIPSQRSSTLKNTNGAACKDLQDDEFVHGDNFNIFVAMSALEIMDPKMDSGLVGKYYYVNEAIENDAASVPISVYKTIDIQCTIDIMDYLLACEATWHKGSIQKQKESLEEIDEKHVEEDMLFDNG